MFYYLLLLCIMLHAGIVKPAESCECKLTLPLMVQYHDTQLLLKKNIKTDNIKSGAQDVYFNFMSPQSNPIEKINMYTQLQKYSFKPTRGMDFKKMVLEDNNQQQKEISRIKVFMQNNSGAPIVNWSSFLSEVPVEVILLNRILYAPGKRVFEEISSSKGEMVPKKLRTIALGSPDQLYPKEIWKIIIAFLNNQAPCSQKRVTFEIIGLKRLVQLEQKPSDVLRCVCKWFSFMPAEGEIEFQEKVKIIKGRLSHDTTIKLDKVVANEMRSEVYNNSSACVVHKYHSLNSAFFKWFVSKKSLNIEDINKELEKVTKEPLFDINFIHSIHNNKHSWGTILHILCVRSKWCQRTQQNLSEILRLLLQRGADPKIRGNLGQRPLDVLMKDENWGAGDEASILINVGKAPVNYRYRLDNDSPTCPLHFAVQAQGEGIARFLLNHGAKIIDPHLMPLNDQQKALLKKCSKEL